MPFHIGPVELIIVLAIIMIIFGVGRLPEIGGAMGKAIRGFRKSVSGEDEQPNEMVDATSQKNRTNRTRFIE
ncbi:MAG: twin-arginine translocase TatA/TatE family subunit [Chloroflexi bacterium]|nr:twin-arginine translocase TatA/TatE family subunit [Chloroflexota bacterium]